ncbi:MAG: hypothetical protein P1U58_09425 [Verrucomicrobiales bacterium]|nr:hypothetical protein [Verrucomicrobiales bacterium]
MRTEVAAVILGVLFTGVVDADETNDAPFVLPPPTAFLDIANTSEGTYPGGATPIEGKWYVEKAAKKLKLQPEPLVIGWLEFGPEFREKGATISALARAPGEGRLRSRIGVGLYGKNGFQLRIDQGKGRVELVRRGIVINSVVYETGPQVLYEMELNVSEDGEDWIVSARVWEYETDRPKEPIFAHRVFADELLFPLAGRSCLIATPFSGEPVQYAVARVYAGDPFAPVEEENSELP